MIFAEATLSFVLAAQARRCSTLDREHLLTFPSIDHQLVWKPTVINPEILTAKSIESALAEDFAAVQEVRHILTEQVEGNLLVWIAIDRADSYELRSRVYDKELALMDGFPEINFDFNLIPALERNAKDLATGARVVYSRP